MGVTQIIFTVIIAIFSAWVIVSIFSQAGKSGSLLYKFYLYALIGLILLGIPLANSVISVHHIGIGVLAGIVFMVVQIMIFGRSEVHGQRVWPSDAVFLMLNKRRRKAIALAKNEQWQEARTIFEALLTALPNRSKHKRMVSMHDITTCCASMGDFLAIETHIDTAHEKYPGDAAFILQLYRNLFEACKEQDTRAGYVKRLEQYVSQNINRVVKFKFTTEEGTALKGVDAANALVEWAKLCE